MKSDFGKIEEWHSKRRCFWGMVVLAYLFALAVRYIWLGWAQGHPEFFWNGQVMINTNDGYFWAEGARDLLAGHHQPGDLSPVHRPLSILTAFLAKVVPVSFETLILWMPALFGSLLVLPVMLIGRALRLDHVGFFAALLAGIAWSYYNRTMIGYYDTDMLTIVLPTFVLWGTILAVLRKRNRFMALTALLLILYQWYYPKAYSLESAFVGMVFLYTLIFERRKLYNYKLVLFMLAAVLPLGWESRLALVAVLFALFHFGGRRSDRLIFPLLGAGIVAFGILGGLEPIWYQIKGYLLRESLAGGSAGNGTDLYYYAVNKTVRESGKIPFEIFANRISGHSVIFVLSIIGYLMMALRYRVMWLALPMLGLGFLAMKGGLRFTVYAVPPMALGMGYLSVWFAQRVSESLTGEERRRRVLTAGILLLILGGVLYPNIRHVVGYKVPTVFVKSEVKVLDGLGKKASREDYVLAWWDYGYPIRYYSDVKTLVDGGKHTGDVNFPVSFALTRPQTASANMARLDVEYTEKAFKEDRNGSYLARMMKDYGVEDPEEFLVMLEDPSMKLPEKTREIYYYLPLRMMSIFPTVAIFGNVDLRTGRVARQPLFYQFFSFRKEGQKILLGGGLLFDMRDGTLLSNRGSQRINAFMEVRHDAAGKVVTRRGSFDASSNLFLIFLPEYRRFLLMDKTMLQSTYIQLFVFEQYDPELFEPVILDPLAKVYRLKR